MNVLARVHLYPPSHCAGAEMMLHELLKALIARGHRCQVHLSRFAAERAPYHLDGVEVYPRATREWQDEARQADVLMTHLDNTSTVVSWAIALNKPLVQVLHNTHAPTRMWAHCRNDLLVFNSEWMARELGSHPNSVIVRPPVRVSDYRVSRQGGRNKVTLVNLSGAKGGVVFAQLAALMPDVEFLGVLGAYGEQLRPNLPNVEIRPHGTDMARVYRDSALVLMPSSYESWGRVGVEAMCSGIPVVAYDHPGLQESLSYAGTLLHPRATAHEFRDVIGELLSDHELYATRSAMATARAAELDPAAELDEFCHRMEALIP